MGVDVYLYAVGEVSDEQMAQAEEFMVARFGSPWDGAGGAWLERDEYSDEPRVELLSGDRYYGPGYERGPWPHIFGQIIAMQACFPDLPIYYGGDTSADGDRVTAELLREIWQHWAGPQGNNYRDLMPAPIMGTP